MRHPVFALAVALGVAQAAHAQATRPLLDPPAFKLDQWTTRDGLPQNSVTAIAQSPEGFLWIGTFGGLARFDGASFRLIERTDSLGRHVDRILSLAVGPDSALWIGTEESGLFRYRRNAYQRFTTAHGLPDHTIRALYVDRAGTLWVGGERGGIARFAGGRFERMEQADGVPFDLVRSFTEDVAGTLWVNTGDRFVTIENGVATTRRWRTSPVAGPNASLSRIGPAASGSGWRAASRGSPDARSAPTDRGPGSPAMSPWWRRIREAASGWGPTTTGSSSLPPRAVASGSAATPCPTDDRAIASARPWSTWKATSGSAPTPTACSGPSATCSRPTRRPTGCRTMWRPRSTRTRPASSGRRPTAGA